MTKVVLVNMFYIYFDYTHIKIYIEHIDQHNHCLALIVLNFDDNCKFQQRNHPGIQLQ